jgi:sugar phosphate isomerase/epimerase
MQGHLPRKVESSEMVAAIVSKAATGVQAMKTSIVLSTQPAQFQAVTFKGDQDANLARIASYGYTGVELAIRDPSLVDLEMLDTLIGKLDLKVPAIGTGQAWGEEGLSFTDPDPSIRRAAISRIKSHIPIASRLNAIIIIGLIRGIVKKGVDPSISMGWLIDALKECSDAASASGIRLALEPINRYETSLINNTAQGLCLIEKVGADNFGLLLDTFHMNIEEQDIESSIKSCGNRIFHFHVADSNRWHPGAGHLNFKSILSSLFSTGYKGWVSGEFLPEPDADTAAQQAMTYLRSATQ